MFLLSLSRIIKFASQNFFRNIWLSIVTITIIVLALFSVTSLVLVNQVIGQAINLVRSRVDTSIYFKPVVTQDQIFLVKSNLEGLGFVKAVKYVSKSESLEKLRARYNDRPLILESLKELDNNPLGDTLIVSTYNIADYQKVVDTINATPEYKVLVEKESYEDSRFIIDRLEKLARQTSGAGLAITIFFTIIAILVMINTIRIAVYTHRNEIGIMKLVGASNWFVRAPFVLEAAFYAILGALITLLLSYILTGFADPYINGLLGPGVFSILHFFNVHWLLIFVTESTGMMIIAVVSTSLALNKYLKV